MSDTPHHGLCLELPGGPAPITDIDQINDALHKVGSRVWPLDIGSRPQVIRTLLRQPSLSAADKQAIMEAFLLPRERILDVIAEAGRQPQVPGGGAMVTHVMPHDYDYPQLFVLEPGVDYSRFDRLHVNVTDEGTGVDEVMWVLCGVGVVFAAP